MGKLVADPSEAAWRHGVLCCHNSIISRESYFKPGPNLLWILTTLLSVFLPLFIVLSKFGYHYNF